MEARVSNNLLSLPHLPLPGAMMVSERPSLGLRQCIYIRTTVSCSSSTLFKAVTETEADKGWGLKCEDTGGRFPTKGIVCMYVYYVYACTWFVPELATLR